MATQNGTPLTIGNIQLTEWEVPSEIPNFFGMQKLAVHDFPGGQRTVQTLGAFPFPSIEWTGQLFDNTSTNAGPAGGVSLATDRAAQLDVMRMQAQPVVLTWATINMQVIVEEFEITANFKQWLTYKIKLVPILDLTAPASDPPDASTLNADLDAEVLNLVANMNAAASGYVFSSSIQQQVLNIQSNINVALLNNQQSIINVPLATVQSIQQQISTLQSNLEPLISGSDYGAVSAAANLYASAGVLNELLQSTEGTPLQISVNDPNLIFLAAQYYGDASQWSVIAVANNLQDYINTGAYTLTLPALANVVAAATS